MAPARNTNRAGKHLKPNPMILNIEGTEVELKFTFKALRALAKILNASKISDLEAMLNKVGYDNCVRLTNTILASSGHKFTDSQVESSIEDPGYPIRLVEAIGAALMPAKDVSEAVVKDINEGN